MSRPETEEINLVDLIARMIRTLRKNIHLTILFPAAGLIIGIAAFIASPPVYQSTLLIETSLLTENECNALLSQEQLISRIQGLSEEQRGSIRNISFKTIRNVSDKVQVPLTEGSIYVAITVEIFNEGDLPNIEKAIVDFLNNSPAVVRHRNDRSQFYDQMISRIETELSRLEEVKKEVGGKTQATFLNPSDLYSSTVDLFKERTEYLIKREEIKSVHVIYGFDVTTSAKRSLLVASAAGFSIGCIVLAAVLVVRYFSRYVITT
jgi:hypothetical protein